MQKELEIRECTTLEELAECVQIQRDVFALPEVELSPVRHLVVTKNAGGFSLGAWDGDQLAGFTLSVPAYINGRRAYYSHMTAIRSEYQNLGLGARLKWAQRERALSEGVDYIRWTFEPAKSRNAFFNLEKLGATTRDYRINFYGTDYGTSPELGGRKLGLDSDRLMADWELCDPKVDALAAGETPMTATINPAAEIVALNDWLGLVEHDLKTARAELLRIGSEFTDAFSRGLTARAFRRDAERPGAFVVLEMSIFEIDRDIRHARTLHSDFYTEKHYFDGAREKIFARSWQFVGREFDLKNTLTPVILLPNVLDEPLVLVRTSEHLSCLANVCTHRGKILIERPCEGELVRCPYHGRKFLLDGTCASMPEFDDVVNFPAESDNLRKLPLAEHGGFLFTSLSPSVEFAELTCDVAGHLKDIDATSLRLEGTREYEVDAHWALYCENYLEGFHIPYVHQGLNRVVDYNTYTTELFRFASLQTGLSPRGVTEASRMLASQPEAKYLFIFPNTMFNFYPWGVSVNIVRPVTKDKTVVEFLTYVRDESSVGEGAGADLHSVELEDEAVVESVQRYPIAVLYAGSLFPYARDGHASFSSVNRGVDEILKEWQQQI